MRTPSRAVMTSQRGKHFARSVYIYSPISFSFVVSSSIFTGEAKKRTSNSLLKGKSVVTILTCVFFISRQRSPRCAALPRGTAACPARGPASGTAGEPRYRVGPRNPLCYLAHQTLRSRYQDHHLKGDCWLWRWSSVG